MSASKRKLRPSHSLGWVPSTIAQPTRGRQHRARRSGAILIVAVVVTFTLVGMVLALCQEMRTESIAAGNRAASAQAESIERGAEQYVLGVLATEGESVVDLSDDQFAAVPVGDGYFWI